MSTAVADMFGKERGETTKGCAVISIYEDLGCRDLLLHLCDSLVWKFKDDLEFQIDWWRFKYLADPEIAMDAARRAAQADLILLAAQSRELPSDVRQWFEMWLPHREAGDGALVLVQPSPKGASRMLPAFLRQTAKRARLDYLRLSASLSAPGAAGTGTGFSLFQPYINELLAEDDQPMHWGINE
jgi:hypothetical protein